MSPDSQVIYFSIAVVLFVIAVILPYTTAARHAFSAAALGLAVAFFVFAYNAYELANP